MGIPLNRHYEIVMTVLRMVPKRKKKIQTSIQAMCNHLWRTLCIICITAVSIKPSKHTATICAVHKRDDKIASNRRGTISLIVLNKLGRKPIRIRGTNITRNEKYIKWRHHCHISRTPRKPHRCVTRRSAASGEDTKRQRTIVVLGDLGRCIIKCILLVGKVQINLGDLVAAPTVPRIQVHSSNAQDGHKRRKMYCCRFCQTSHH